MINFDYLNDNNNENSPENLYYAHPVQVLYWDEYTYKEGIAFHDWIVDVTTGAAKTIAKTVKRARAAYMHPLDDDLIIELSWVDLRKSFDEGLNSNSFNIRTRPDG